VSRFVSAIGAFGWLIVLSARMRHRCSKSIPFQLRGQVIDFRGGIARSPPTSGLLPAPISARRIGGPEETVPLLRRRKTLSSPEARLIAVAVPVPGLGVLTYAVPADAPVPHKGARVSVPLGTRLVVGVVAAHDAAPPADPSKIREINSVIDDAAFLPAAVVDIALWVGEYYASGPGESLTMAMPPAARRGEVDAFRMVSYAELLDPTFDETTLRGAKQRDAIIALRAAEGGRLLLTVLRPAYGRA
jgi:hypothetical protein